MPAPARIGALIATLVLFAAPAAVAQNGGGGGAGDSQYQDPFGSTTPSKPKAPARRQQPAQQQPSPQPTPDHTAPAPSATAPAAEAQAQAPSSPTRPAQTLPRTGFDVLPVAAAGLLLVLGGLALRRRPHGER
jgi:LPXTG-motif cell wall-anchored protein